MNKLILTAYGKPVAVSEIKEFFTEIFIKDKNDPPYMVGAILKNGDIICIARLFNPDLKAMLFSSLYGIIRNPQYKNTVFNTKLEVKKLKKIHKSIQYVTNNSIGYDEIMNICLHELMYGIEE